MNAFPLNLRRDVRHSLAECMRRHLRTGDVVYDVGCGTKPFAPALASLGVVHVGVDMDNGFYGEDAVDIIGVADALPLRAGVADAVLSSQVIEHLPDPEVAMREAHRVLKPGGLLFISFPLLFPLHAAPYDFFRYTEHGFQAMCRRGGFEIVEVHEMGGFWYMLSVFGDRYANTLDRSIVKRLRLVPVLSFPARLAWWALHNLEGAAYAAVGKNVRGARRTWAVNYVYVARRSPAASDPAR
ncbi:MAG TPA: class I SAM-dependent methyltransferase [Candidatus Krumholzibacteria bacterium]|nr:class I SAM-dependent methyltransferase [Candidatus Krumholzibacteria bacterium]